PPPRGSGSRLPAVRDGHRRARRDPARANPELPAARIRPVVGPSDARLIDDDGLPPRRRPLGSGSWQDQPMSGTVAEREPESGGSQLGDAVLDAMRGALRILGGMVQMAAGITRLVAVAALKAAEAASDAVEAAEADEDEPEPKPRRSTSGGS